jgi:glycosyltransferase involved in cell wall biosynthesis
VIYVFYHNDPLAQDLGGGAEHFRCLHRALAASDLPYRLVASRLQDGRAAPEVLYIAQRPGFLRFYLALWLWFWRHRGRFAAEDVFHFHRNYAAWPKLLLAPRRGRVIVSYHNVTGRVLEGSLGRRLAAPVRCLMLAFERRVAALADAIVCVSGRDRRELARLVAPEPFERASVVPAAFDASLFGSLDAAPPAPELAGRVLVLGRISHQKNVPLAVAVLEALAAAGERHELTIAGRGEGSKDLIRLIARSPAAARIRWVGAVPHDEVPALLREHGILLLTSRYEASPTVLKEALRVMRPVVSTDVGDVPDWLEPDRTGYVCDATPEALAEGVRAASRLIREGRYRVTGRLEQLDEGRLMNEVLTLYRQLAAR